MLRGTWTRGGALIIVAAILSLPPLSATVGLQDTGFQQPATPPPGASAPGLEKRSGWLADLWALLKSLVGADESGGTFEPNGQNGETSACGGDGQDPCPEPTTTTSNGESTGGGFTTGGGP